jgi:hypothetical protein
VGEFIAGSLLAADLLAVVVAGVVHVPQVFGQFGPGGGLDVSRVSVLENLHVLHGDDARDVERGLQEVGDLDDGDCGDLLLQQLHDAQRLDVLVRVLQHHHSGLAQERPQHCYLLDEPVLDALHLGGELGREHVGLHCREVLLHLQQAGEVQGSELAVAVEAPADVLADGAVEVEVVAGDHSELPQPVPARDLADVHAAQPDGGGLGLEEGALVEHGQVLGERVEQQVAEAVVLLVQQHDLPFLHRQREDAVLRQHLTRLLQEQVVELEAVPLEGGRDQRGELHFLAIVVERAGRVCDFDEGDEVDGEEGLEGEHFADDGLEHFGDVHEEEDGGGDDRDALLPVVDLHLDAVLDADGQQRDRQQVAHQRQPVGRVALRQLVRRQLLVLLFSAGQYLIFEAADVEELRSLDALLQGADVVVLVVVVVFDDAPLHLPEEVEDRVIDRGQHHEDGDQLRTVRRNELDSRDQDHHVLINAQNTVAGNEHLLVVLHKYSFTWLYLSASFTLSSRPYQDSRFLPSS